MRFKCANEVRPFQYVRKNRSVKTVCMQEVGFMGVSVSGSVSGIKDVTIATSGKGEPNWSYIPSAGKSNKSKAKFTSEFKKLAKKAALSTNKTQSEYISRQVLQLRAEYLSDVAPDRKMLYQ